MTTNLSEPKFYLDPRYRECVERDVSPGSVKGFFKGVWSAILEVLMPVSKNSLTWIKGGGAVDSVCALLFAKPWTYLLLVTIVAVFILFILAVCSFAGALDNQQFVDGVRIPMLVVCSLCICYTGAAILLWKRKYTYNMQTYKSNIKVANGDTTMTAGSSAHENAILNIETSIIGDQ